MSPLFDPTGQLHGAICLFTDLTAVKDLEEQLRLKESLATVGELTAGIAHEFRNGLATIHGYSKLFDLNALPESYRPYVEGIRAETESLSQVVTNFLNFARPAQLTLTARRSARDLRARGRGDPRRCPRARRRRRRARRVRRASRATKCCCARRSATCCATRSRRAPARAAPPRIVDSVGDRSARRRLSRIAVNDNGPGIAPALRERVFRPFFTSKRNGTGLGLALVQKIIVFHNGRIVVGTSPDGRRQLPHHPADPALNGRSLSKPSSPGWFLNTRSVVARAPRAVARAEPLNERGLIV